MGNTYSYSFVEKTVRSNRWARVEDCPEDFGKSYHLWHWIHKNHDKVEFDYDNNMVVFSKEFVKETRRRLRALYPLFIRHIEKYNDWGDPFFKDSESETVNKVLDYWMPDAPVSGDKYDMWYFSDLHRTLEIFNCIHTEKLEDGVVQLALTWV